MLRYWCLVSILFLDGCLLAAPQSYLRGWNGNGFDTRSREQPITQVAASYFASIVLHADGRAYANGDGIGSVHPQWLGPGLRYDSVDIGFLVAGGRVSDGSVRVWGNHIDPTYLMPPSLPWGTTIAQFTAGGEHCAALRSDGQIEVWGRLTSTPSLAQIPGLPPGTTYTFVDSGRAHCVALRSDGVLVAWGRGVEGQLNVPAVPQGVYYSRVVAGGFHNLAMRSDGVLVAFGDDSQSQCQIPGLPSGLGYVEFGAGDEHSLAVRSDGAVLAWGRNDKGQCTVPILGPAAVASLAGGLTHSVALLADGSLHEWGDYVYTQHRIPRLLPGQRWMDISCGSGHVLALDSTGKIQTTGAWDVGFSPPPPLPPSTGYTQVAAGYIHNYALRSDGAAIGWGSNFAGALNQPALPPGMRWEQVAVSHSHTVLLRSDGEAFAFGNNLSGQCNVPALPAGTRYLSVDASNRRTVLRRSDGATLLVGDSSYGAGNYPALPAGVDYLATAVGNGLQYALRSDGLIEEWPSPTSGPTYPVPSRGTYYVEIDNSPSTATSIARLSDGSIRYGGGPGLQIPSPLDPGESYVQVSADFSTVARVGPTSTYVGFAMGCAGTLPPSRLVPLDTPSIDRLFEVNVFDLPNDAAFMVFGWRRIAPIDLTGYGMPNCSQEISLDAAVFLSGQNGVARYRLPIPNAPGLVGLRFYNQAVVLDPAAGNLLGAVVSDAAEGVIGQF